MSAALRAEVAKLHAARMSVATIAALLRRSQTWVRSVIDDAVAGAAPPPGPPEDRPPTPPETPPPRPRVRRQSRAERIAMIRATLRRRALTGSDDPELRPVTEVIR